MIAALQKVSPGVGTRAIELLEMGADPGQVVLPTLLNDLDAIAYPIVLILDDYHLVKIERFMSRWHSSSTGCRRLFGW